MKTQPKTLFRQRRIAALGVIGAGLLSLALCGLTGADAQDAKSATTNGAAVSAAAAPTFSVGGAVSKPSAWSAARLEQEFAEQVKTVDYLLKGARHKAKCVPLAALLSASRPRVNGRIKHHELAFSLLVQGKDGYTVAFSWGELLPDVGKSAAWLALERDGVPLPTDASPVELIVPGDEKPGRWVHGVSKIVVIDGAALPDDGKSVSLP